MKHWKVALVIGVLVAMAALGMVQPLAAQIDQQDYGPDLGWGGVGICPYCGDTACGCSPAVPPLVLSYSCSCSSIWCSRTCTYS
jgi:hypothetical protein